jgi:hypothetical protein
MPHALYNTNLSKAQGMVPETLELLDLWEPGMTAKELRQRVHETGALSRQTAARINDLVTRGFAQRYLLDGDKPAIWLKRLLQAGINTSALKQILLIYTARHNPVFRDFVTTTYWRRATNGSRAVSPTDARDFLESAVSDGRIQPRWADSMMVRVVRYLLGTLEDFQLIDHNRDGCRNVQPPGIFPETARYLAHDLHFSGMADAEIPGSPDWALFGLYPADVVAELDKEAARGHLQVQNAGQFLRIEWHYPSMEHAIDAINR